MNKPNPGSPEAVEAGCKCPVIDNGRGRGAYTDPTTNQPEFWISENCPIHGCLHAQQG